MTDNPPPRTTASVRRLMAGALLVGYGGLLAVVALYPTPVDRPVSGLLQRMEEWLPGSYDVLEFASNVALFVPLGLLVALQLPRRMRWVGVAVGAAVSVSIELLQAAVLPERFATPSDVIANTLGATIGVLLLAAPRWRRAVVG